MNSALKERILSQIRQSGPLPFSTFMETALYDPKHGFYASGKTRTGKGGDFLTPVSPGPVLGQLLARQADEWHQALGRPRPIRFIEQGADSGWLARDLLHAVHSNHPELAQVGHLHVVEPHPKLAETQRETLASSGLKTQTHWHASWETVPDDGMACFFYSCELVDSFPIRIFRYRAGAWREQLVGLTGGDFSWQEVEIDPDILGSIRHWDPPESEGFTVELRPQVETWIRDWTKKISLGLVVTLDYGFPSREMFSPERGGGTLMALRQHRASPNPLEDPGDQDLSAHVNFTELEELGARSGWKSHGLTDFSRGMTALASPLLRQEGHPGEAWVRNFRHLTHPSFFGHTHKILVQGKGLPATFQPTISGKLQT